MRPFHGRCPEIAMKEVRSVTVLDDGQSVPPGQYGLLEFYCDDPECDCRRVLFQVVRSDTGGKVWATINYGWESAEYYARWLGSAEAGREACGASLDPLHPQSEYAPALLDLFTDVILADASYVERLKRHYRMFRDAGPKAKATPTKTQPWRKRRK